MIKNIFIKRTMPKIWLKSMQKWLLYSILHARCNIVVGFTWVYVLHILICKLANLFLYALNIVTVILYKINCIRIVNLLTFCELSPWPSGLGRRYITSHLWHYDEGSIPGEDIFFIIFIVIFIIIIIIIIIIIKQS